MSDSGMSNKYKVETPTHVRVNVTHSSTWPGKFSALNYTHRKSEEKAKKREREIQFSCVH